MTYDKLLAQIEAHQNDYSPQATDTTAWEVLRAVVELCIHFNNSTVSTEFLVSFIEKELNK